MRTLICLLLVIPAFVVFVGEFAIFYPAIWTCRWQDSQTTNHATNSSGVRLLILSDPHILGKRQGHWLDKLKREWQMHRSFQTAVSLLQPDGVVFLGDLFDEGWWSYDPREYGDFVSQFWALFPGRGSGGGTAAWAHRLPVYIAVGNHDIGFHDMLNERRTDWFDKAFGAGPVNLTYIGGIPFVIVNSMAFEDDGCRLCETAKKQLLAISRQLFCRTSASYSNSLGVLDSNTKGLHVDNRNSDECLNNWNPNESPLPAGAIRPVLLSHFPLYRRSDAHCTEPDQSEDVAEKYKNMIPKMDTISKSSSELLLRSLRPQAIFTGHTHSGCLTKHRLTGVPEVEFLEWTVSSFSWRNRDNPGFLLASFDSSDSVENKPPGISRCVLPRESTILTMYRYAAIVICCLVLFILFRRMKLKFFPRRQMFIDKTHSH